MSAGDIALLKDIERLLGYPVERISLPDYDYEGGTQAEQPAKPVAKVNRGSRLGTRKAKELSADELRELLKVG
jgi:hypothetical protein